MAEAVNGGMKKRRLPWLAVHMPRFQHSDAERSALLAAFISHDRVPDDAPESAVARTEAAQAHGGAEPEEESRLVAGQRLVGPGGFSCIACHEMGRLRSQERGHSDARFRPDRRGPADAARILPALDRALRCGFAPEWRCPPTSGRSPACFRTTSPAVGRALGRAQRSALHAADQSFVRRAVPGCPPGRAGADRPRRLCQTQGYRRDRSRGPLPSVSTTAIPSCSISTCSVCGIGPWGISPVSGRREKAGFGTWPGRRSPAHFEPASDFALAPTARSGGALILPQRGIRFRGTIGDLSPSGRRRGAFVPAQFRRRRDAAIDRDPRDVGSAAGHGGETGRFSPPDRGRPGDSRASRSRSRARASSSYWTGHRSNSRTDAGGPAPRPPGWASSAPLPPRERFPRSVSIIGVPAARRPSVECRRRRTSAAKLSSPRPSTAFRVLTESDCRWIGRSCPRGSLGRPTGLWPSRRSKGTFISPATRTETGSKIGSTWSRRGWPLPTACLPTGAT